MSRVEYDLKENCTILTDNRLEVFYLKDIVWSTDMIKEAKELLTEQGETVVNVLATGFEVGIYVKKRKDRDKDDTE